MYLHANRDKSWDLIIMRGLEHISSTNTIFLSIVEIEAHWKTILTCCLKIWMQKIKINHFLSSIMEKTNTLPNETIHITSKCIMHLRDHRNKWCPSWNFLYVQILTTTLNSTTSIIAYKFKSLLLEQHQWESPTCIKYLNTSSLTLVVYIDCKINFNLYWTKIAKISFAYMPNPKFNNTCFFFVICIP